MQKKRHSLLETVMSTAIGYVVAVLPQLVIYPWFGVHIDIHANMAMAGVFTVVSVIRGYWVRRLFNYLHVKGVL